MNPCGTKPCLMSHGAPPSRPAPRGCRRIPPVYCPAGGPRLRELVGSGRRAGALTPPLRGSRELGHTRLGHQGRGARAVVLLVPVPLPPRGGRLGPARHHRAVVEVDEPGLAPVVVGPPVVVEVGRSPPVGPPVVVVARGLVVEVVLLVVGVVVDVGIEKGSRSDESTRPGKLDTGAKLPVSIPRRAAPMKRRNISAGMLPPLTPGRIPRTSVILWVLASG